MNSATPPPAVKTTRPLAQNRRRGNRHQLEIPATLIPDEKSAAHLAITVTEISIAGVGFRSKTELAIDAVYQLTSFDTLVPPGMRVKIVSQQPSSHGDFKIGAQTI